MIVNQTAEYALRAAAYLAGLPPNERARAADISSATSIPTHYLSKVMRKLVVAKICDSKKGHHGGFSLSRPASEITFLEIMRAADFEPAPDRCAFGLETCDPNQPCPLHDAWARMNDTFVAYAQSTTLAGVRDLAITPSSRLAELMPPSTVQGD